MASVDQMEVLTHGSDPAPVRLWYLTAPASERVDLDEQTLGELRALGYVQ